MKIDFLICYEFWQRELYGVTQLRIQLEGMGYHVKVLRIHPKIYHCLEEYLYEPKVVVYPWVYSNVELKRARSFLGDCQKIVNMQCEQLLRRRVLENGFFKIREGALQAFHVSWGEKTYNRFIGYGIAKDHIWNIGNINLEINERRYDACFKSRKELADEYKLDIDKQWFLFCSNFKLVNTPLRELFNLEKRSANILMLAASMRESRAVILKWMAEYVAHHQDIEIIYRPHPLERKDSEMEYLQGKYENFNYIPDLTVNHWVRVCDKCATWKSTAIMDAIYIGIPAAFLMPMGEPELLKGDIDHVCVDIVNYQEFETFLKCKENVDYGQPDKNIESLCTMETESIERLSEKLDELYKSADEHRFSQDMSEHVRWTRQERRIKINLIRYWMSKYFYSRYIGFFDDPLCKELYEDTKREKDIYKNMLKARKGKVHELFIREEKNIYYCGRLR